MAKMVKVRNVARLGRVVDYYDERGALVTVLAEAGAVVEVPEQVAGRPPADGDLGDGLLAQTSVWQPANPPKPPKPPAPKPAPETEEAA